MTSTTIDRSRSTRSTTLIRGAGLTAFAAVLFPRLNAVIYDHERIWHFDSEAAVLAPAVVAITLVLFAAASALARRGSGDRAATLSLVASIVGVLGVIAFFVSTPIILGGLAVTLGVEALRQDPLRRRRALVGITIGAIAILVGAGIWLAGI